MEVIDRGGTAGGPALMRRLEAIGTGKQTSRLDALRAIGLIREVGDGTLTLTLTGSGRRSFRPRAAFPRQCS